MTEKGRLELFKYMAIIGGMALIVFAVLMFIGVDKHDSALLLGTLFSVFGVAAVGFSFKFDRDLNKLTKGENKTETVMTEKPTKPKEAGGKEKGSRKEKKEKEAEKEDTFLNW